MGSSCFPFWVCNPNSHAKYPLFTHLKPTSKRFPRNPFLDNYTNNRIHVSTVERGNLRPLDRATDLVASI